MSTDTNSAATASFESADQSLMVEAPEQAGLKGSARHWLLCLLIAGLGGLAFAVDIPISQMMVEKNWPQPVHRLQGTIHRALETIEPFGQPVAIISVSLAVLLCGGPGRGVGFRILAGSFGAGLVVNVLKISVARIRPKYFNFQGSVSDTFHSFFPGRAGSSQIQSWPSGHTAMAVGFCLALSTVFPRGRWLFNSLAVLVAMQRIESGSHYLSDTLFATAVAYGVWIVVFGHGRVGRLIDRIEAWWEAR